TEVEGPTVAGVEFESVDPVTSTRGHDVDVDRNRGRRGVEHGDLARSVPIGLHLGDDPSAARYGAAGHRRVAGDLAPLVLVGSVTRIVLGSVLGAFLAFRIALLDLVVIMIVIVVVLVLVGIDVFVRDRWWRGAV